MENHLPRSPYSIVVIPGFCSSDRNCCEWTYSLSMKGFAVCCSNWGKLVLRSGSELSLHCLMQYKYLLCVQVIMTRYNYNIIYTCMIMSLVVSSALWGVFPVTTHSKWSSYVAMFARKHAVFPLHKAVGENFTPLCLYCCICRIQDHEMCVCVCVFVKAHLTRVIRAWG